MENRRTKAALPVFLIALLAFIWMPAAASVAMGASQANAPGAAPICQQNTLLDRRGDAPSSPLHKTDCCVFCHFVSTGAALPPPSAEIRARLGRPVQIAWTHAHVTAPPDARRPPSQPRAPPKSNIA